ncbi:MAG: hypothetical protein FNT15_05035 [Sulfurovum sp.]|jgi:hypothetical protein|nr:MAG: hypothetical protein FNT15_05035 [Sulfurovum sp.]
MKKVFFHLLGLFIAIFLSTGCTKALWKERAITHNVYIEKIESFMLNPENGGVIFLGEKYHYIFDENEDLNFLLAHRKSKGMVFNVSDGYHSTNKNMVMSSFSVAIDKSIADKEIVDWLMKKNYTQTKINFPIYIKGTRYIADKKVNAVAQKLSKVFVIRVSEEEVGQDDIAIKILLTPITLFGDGVGLILGGVGLIFDGIGSIIK